MVWTLVGKVRLTGHRALQFAFYKAMPLWTACERCFQKYLCTQLGGHPGRVPPAPKRVSHREDKIIGRGGSIMGALEESCSSDVLES